MDGNYEIRPNKQIDQLIKEHFEKSGVFKSVHSEKLKFKRLSFDSIDETYIEWEKSHSQSKNEILIDIRSLTKLPNILTRTTVYLQIIPFLYTLGIFPLWIPKSGSYEVSIAKNKKIIDRINFTNSYHEFSSPVFLLFSSEKSLNFKPKLSRTFQQELNYIIKTVAPKVCSSSQT